MNHHDNQFPRTYCSILNQCHCTSQPLRRSDSWPRWRFSKKLYSLLLPLAPCTHPQTRPNASYQRYNMRNTRAANHPTTFTMHQFQVKCWNYAAGGFDWSTRTIPGKLHFKSNLISALIELSIEAVCAQVLSYAIPLHLLHNKSDR